MSLAMLAWQKGEQRPEQAAVAEIPLYVVEARELHPLQRHILVHWRWLTPHLVKTLDQALQVIRWYAWR